MESARKRKASIATQAAAEGSATKRLKLLNSTPAAVTKSKVQEIGNKIVEQLHRSADKTGRLIATEFLELPDRDDFPDYYESTKVPIAIETIEAKVKRNEYATITAIESDLKRMVQNAKDYNDPHSQIYDDAEKIRKLVFNFMKQHNPAYTEQPGYSAFPTPIPEPMQNTTKSRRKSEPSGRKSSVARSAATAEPEIEDEANEEEAKYDEVDDDAANEGNAESHQDVGDGGKAPDLDLTGKTFQEAQEEILEYLLRHTDEEGLQIYTPFGNLPSRRLEDYYRFIRHPVSIRSVAKRARGEHGRAAPSGASDFKTWEMFEEEVSYIWRNAKAYNEDGSEMFDLAIDFEEHFRSLMEDAKAKVDGPSAPRIKLGGPKPKVTLNLAQRRTSTTPTTPGVTVDNDALQRQRQVVQAGVNGQQQTKQSTPPTTARAGSASQSVPAAESTRPSSSAHSGSPLPIKVEKTATQSPALNGTAGTHQPLTNGTMPPPLTRPLSASPLPPNRAPTFHHPAPALLPPTRLRSYPLESALLPALKITTHPHLRLPKPYSLAIPPHVTLSHQSATITLPTSHYYLQIAPTISKPLSMGRPYKMFVLLNGTRLTQRDTHFHADSGKRTHIYDGTLAPGVNRIEVEVAAAAASTANENKDNEDTPNGITSESTAPAVGGGKTLDVEKVTIFANLVR